MRCWKVRIYDVLVDEYLVMDAATADEAQERAEALQRALDEPHIEYPVPAGVRCSIRHEYWDTSNIVVQEM